MARIVGEIMNRELFSARPNERVSELADYFSTLGIHASPVIDADDRLVGMVSLRDLVNAAPDDHVDERMNAPAVSIRRSSSIEEAARLLGDTGYHSLPVVDAEEHVVGIVSSIDVIGGLTGRPVRHPPAFSRYEPDTGITWTPDTELSLDHVEVAPEGSGVIALVHGGEGRDERIVWAETSSNMRKRLVEMLTSPRAQVPVLRYWLDQSDMRFRAAALADRKLGARVTQRLTD